MPPQSIVSTTDLDSAVDWCGRTLGEEPRVRSVPLRDPDGSPVRINEHAAS